MPNKILHQNRDAVVSMRESNASHAEIADHFGVTKSSVAQYLNFLGVEKFRRVKEIKDPELTDRQKSILVGTILGDAHLNQARTRRYAYLYLNHGWKQETYLRWKVNQLQPLFKQPPSYTKRLSVRGNSVNAISRSFPMLTDLHQLFYRPKKQISAEILEQVDDIALAVWFADDGTCHIHPWRARSTLGLLLGGVTQEEIQLVEDWIWDRWRIAVKQHKKTECTTLYFGVTQAEQLAELISPHLPICMSYKLRGVGGRISVPVDPPAVG